MISIKFTPDLRFVEDQSFAEAEKIENLLKSPQVQRDLQSSDPDETNDE
jgi:ribosome-binding factor A